MCVEAIMFFVVVVVPSNRLFSLKRNALWILCMVLLSYHENDDERNEDENKGDDNNLQFDILPP